MILKFRFGLYYAEFWEFYSTACLPYDEDRRRADRTPKPQYTPDEMKEENPMVIEKSAIAGTLESSDAQVTVEPCSRLELEIESSVLNQYGRQIRATVLETLERLDVQKARVIVIDKGALDCTLKARVECAVFRSCDASAHNIPWGGSVQ